MSQPSPLATSLPWNLVAEAYTAEIAPFLARFSEDALRLAALRPGDRVADVATGPGTLALLAARAEARVEALDFAQDMIDRLRIRAAREGLPVVAVVGDGTALPWADGAFDAAFSMFGLIFFADRAKGLSELARVLVPGGRAVVASWVPMERAPLMFAMFRAVLTALPHIPFPEEKPALSTPEELRAEMTAAGLRDVYVNEVEHALDLPSTDAAWELFERTMAPIVLLRKRVGGDAWSNVSAAARATLRRDFGSGPAKMTMIANLAVGKKAL